MSVLNNVSEIKTSLVVKSVSASNAALMALLNKVTDTNRIVEITENFFPVFGETNVFVSYEDNPNCVDVVFVLDMGNGFFTVNTTYQMIKTGELKVLKGGELALEIVANEEIAEYFTEFRETDRVINLAERNKTIAWHKNNSDDQEAIARYIAASYRPVKRVNGEWILRTA